MSESDGECGERVKQSESKREREVELRERERAREMPDRSPYI